MKITAEQAKLQLDLLLDRAAAGEEVIIVRDGRPIARMVAASAAVGPDANGTVAPGTDDGPPQRLGWARDIITYVAPDFDEPLEDFREYME